MQQRVFATGPSRMRLVAVLAFALVFAGGCVGDDDDDDNATPDGGSDTDTGDWVCPDVEWGSGMSTGNAVSNWAMSGFIDGDLDGVVEQEQVDFTLEDIHCTGQQSLVVMWGDTS